MKKIIFGALACVTIAVVGCVQTVTDSHAFAISPGAKDTISGRYQRPMADVYQASVAVVSREGVLLTEFVPHEYTNDVRQLEGRVSDCKVFIKVEQVDPQLSQVDVEARTKMGRVNIDLVHQLEKDIALELAAH